MKTRAPRYNPALSMTIGQATLVRLAPLALAAAATAAGVSDTPRTFDAEPVGRPPAGFTFHVARDRAAPRWLVEREQANGFLAHRGEAGHAGFALALLVSGATSAPPVSLSARLRLSGGQRSGGIVWGVQDADNYYLARLDLDRQDIALYRVTAGNRTRIEGEDDLELDPTAWHTLRVVQQEESIRVYLGGIGVLRARDRTFNKGGRVGLWCAGDAVAHFDDLRVGTVENKDSHADPRRGR